MLASVVAGLVLSGLGQEAARDWEFRAGRWETVALDLSEELGVPVEVKDSIKDEVVIGKFRSRTDSGMAKAFSEATMTKWVNRDGVIEIGPDGTARKQYENQEKRELVAYIQKQIDEWTVNAFDESRVEEALEFAKDFPSFSEEKKEEVIQSELFSYAKASLPKQLLMDFVKEVGAEFFAEILLEGARESKRVVYSTHPTRFQLPMGELGQRLISLDNARRKIVADFRARNLMAEQQSIFGIAFVPPVSRKDTDRLTVSVASNYGRLQLELKSFDENGTIIWSSGVEYLDDSSSDFYGSRMELEKWDTPLILESGEEPFLDIYLLKPEDKSGQRKARHFLRSISDIDPCSFGVTDYLYAYAKRLDCDVAGVIDRYWLLTYPYGVESGVPSGRWLSNYLYSPNRGSLSREIGLVKEGVLTVRPVRKSFDSLRLEALKFVGESAIDGVGLTLEDQFKLCQMTEDSNDFSQSMIMALQLSGVERNSYLDYRASSHSEYLPLRLFSLLPSQIQERARQGGASVRVDQLPLEFQRVLLSDLNLYGSLPEDDVLPFLDRQGLPTGRQKISEAYGEWGQESTVFYSLPEASPVVLNVKWSREQAIRTFLGSRRLQGTLDGLAFHVSGEEKLDGYPGLLHGAVLDADELVLEFKIGDAFYKRYVATGLLKPPGPVVEWKDLPEDLRLEFDQRLNYYRSLRDQKAGNSAN